MWINTTQKQLLYIYSVSKYSLYCVCIWLCVLHWMIFRLKVCLVFCVCVFVCCLNVVQSPWRVRYIILALNQSTSCFKSIQTSTTTEETVICVSAAQGFFRPKQLELYESYCKINNYLLLFCSRYCELRPKIDAPSSLQPFHQVQTCGMS